MVVLATNRKKKLATGFYSESDIQITAEWESPTIEVPDYFLVIP